MTTDALTSTTLTTLADSVLPQLQQKLVDLMAIDPSERLCDEDLQYLMRETVELIKLLEPWAKGEALQETAPLPSHSELSDEDAKMLLADMDDLENLNENIDDELSDAEAKMLLADMDDLNNSTQLSDMSEDMSDEEAQILLAGMDGEAPESSEDGELSDEEAKMLLADMDDLNSEAGDEEMSDEDAKMLLEDMDGGTAISPAEDGELSDEEAKMLLADMDDLNSEAGDEEMSDAAAQALLADMDNETPDNDTEFDPEQEALALMNAFEDDPLETAVTPEPEDTQPANTGDLPEEVASLEEIEEFGNSEFGSDPDMIKDFLDNAEELMETLDDQVLALESDPTNKEIIEEIFRAAHTLKGAAGMFGYKAIERVMHRMENYFDLVRKEKLLAKPNSIDIVLKGLDVLKELMEGVQKGAPTGIKTVPIVRELSLIGMGKEPTGALSESTSATETAPSSQPTAQGAGSGDAPPAPKTAKKAEDSTIRVDLARLDNLVNLVGELVTDRTRFIDIEENLREAAPSLSMVGSLTETNQLFGRHMNEIQNTIMKIRMVPIGNAFNKFTRIVRDLSRQLGKQINLIIEGESTELDKTLVEKIGDPLVHLIRNACDHGVEMPDDRVAQGKPPAGNIFLSAHQEGNYIMITIQDEGKGMNPDIIRKKGIENGLITEDDKLTDKEIFALIFEPGFSTAEAVTNISGRGVGMDVVKKQINKMKGIVEIDSKMGKGTTITIQLPLTLAIVQSLLVRVKDEIFAIPQSAIIESFRTTPEEIQNVGETEVIKRRDQVLPLLHLDHVLSLEKKDDEYWYDKDQLEEEDSNNIHRLKKSDRIFVVVVRGSDATFGIVVDSLLHQQEMVIKSMGKAMKGIPCIAGGAILGSGEVVLVLDISDLDQQAKTINRQLSAA